MGRWRCRARNVLFVILGLASEGCQLGSSRSAAPAPELAPDIAAELEEATISELQARMTAGTDSARSLAEKYLARIAALDAAGPALHSVIELNPDALSIADALDAERKAKGPRGPLHGIPVLIKDNIATADRMETTAGSLALVGCKPPADAFIVKQLRDAGAVILGKTNLSEWANFRSTRSVSGWSGRGGQTKNPYALDRNPSGSSSGSGAAVAANLCAVAVGTETDGSITSPSNNNMLVGIKPTIGLVSRFGIVPIAHSQDTAGPMARTVTDAAILLGVLAGHDPNDPGDPTLPRPEGLVPHEFSRHLTADGLRGARIGVVRKQLTGYHGATDALFEQAIADLKRLGAEIVDPADIPHVGEYGSGENLVLQSEFKTDLEKYFAWLGSGSKIHTLDDVISFDLDHAAAEMPFFGQEILVESARRGPLTDEKYLAALERNHRLSREEGIDAVLKAKKLDALVAPTSGPAWLIDPIYGDAGSGSATSPPAVSGYPHVTVPMGEILGLPVGISFMGTAWSEEALIRFAFAYEQGTRHRRAPRFAPTVAR